MRFRAETDGGTRKPPNHKHNYTHEEMIEFQKCCADPIYFIKNYCWIIHKQPGSSQSTLSRFELYEYQQRMLKHYMENQKTVTLVSRQSGKALALDTPILTTSGWKTMEAIHIGDEIYGDDGKPTRVTFVTDSMYGHKCYKITFDNGESIIADAEHVWTVYSENWKQKEEHTTEELIDIKIKLTPQGQGLHVALSKAIDFSEKELMIDPYVLGLWLGDGSKGSGVLTGHRDDLSIFEMCLGMKGYHFGKSYVDKRNPMTEQRTILGLMTQLKELGVFRAKHIPQEYLFASIEQRLELLRGLMDTDGFCNPHGRCEFYQKSRPFMNDFRVLLSRLGIKSRIRDKVVNGEIYYTVAFTTKKYNVFKLPRKIERQLEAKGHQKNTRIYIASIESVESVPVKCISVDNPSHLYLCGKTLIPTHNTESAAAFILWWTTFKQYQHVLITSYIEKGAKQILRRIKFMYERVPWFLKAGIGEDGWNQLSLRFDNFSTIDISTTTGNSGRGDPLSLLYVDELAYVSPNIAAEFWTSVLPTVADSGKIIVTSTANTDEDKFAQIWLNRKLSPYSDKWVDKNAVRHRTQTEMVEKEEERYPTIYEDDAIRDETEMAEKDDEMVEGFVGFHAHWRKVPGRNEKWKQTVLASATSSHEWDRDYECSFLTKEATLISAAKLLALNFTVRPPLFIDHWGMRWYEEIKSNTAYAVTLDPRDGIDKNDACLQVYEIPKLKQVMEWNSNTVDQPSQAKMLMRALRRIYDMQQQDPMHDGSVNIYYSVEYNGLGRGILMAIEMEGEQNFPGWLLDSENNKHGRGLMSSPATKRRFAIEFADLVERNLILLRSKRLVSQLKTFVKKGQSYKAKPGAKDDLVMGSILMMQLLDEIRNHEGDLDDHIQVEMDDEKPDPNNPEYMPMLPMMG